MKHFVLKALCFSVITIVSFAKAPSLYARTEDNVSAVQTVTEDELEAIPENSAEDILKAVQSKPVTVVGSRLASLQVPFADVPANVSYVAANVSNKSGEEIYETQPKTLQDSLKELEGVVLFDEVGNGLDTTFSLRGFNESSAVIVLVDGVRVNEVDGSTVVFPVISMDNLESIQVDRGSASPIFGSNAFAGVVHITTRKPSENKISVFGGLEWSSFDSLRFHSGLSGTIPDDLTGLAGELYYYFSGGRSVSNGFRPNGESRITSFDFKTGYELPDNDGSLNFLLKHVDDAISNPGELTFDQYQASEDRTNKPLDGRDYRTTILQLTGDKKLFDDKVTASAQGSIRVNRNHFYNTSGTFTDFVDGFNPDTNVATNKSRQSSLITQLAYDDVVNSAVELFGMEPLDWFRDQSMIGLELVDEDLHSVLQDAPDGNVAPFTSLETLRAADTYAVGLYWRETVEFFDRLIGHFGMRHDWHELKTRDDLNRSNDLKVHWNNSSLSTGVTAQPLDAVDVFANYSQGFRVPTISELAPFASGINRNLLPEKSNSYEIGTRLRFKDKAEGKFSWFLIDMEDEIVFDSTSLTVATPFGRNINVGKSRRTGIEARVDVDPIEEIESYLSYTWTKAYVRETDAGGTLVDGRSLGQIPEHRMTWGAVFTPFERVDEFLAGLKIGIHGTFTGKQHPANFESTSQATLNATGGAGHIIKSYTLWDFIASFNFKGQEIYFKINNIFDNKYYSRAISATSFGTAIYPAGTYTFVNPGAPREFVLGTRWEIG